MRIRSNRNWCVLAALSALSLVTFPAMAGDKEKEHSTSSSKMSDKEFVQEAMKGNQAEVALAEVAAQKAQNAELKEFAQHLQKDHTQANEQLRPIAESLGVQTSQSLDEKHQKKLTRFQEMQGAEFDKEFAIYALKDHKKDIAKYEKAQGQVQNPQLRQYISQTLPKLQQHFQHGKQVAQAVGVDQSTLAEIERQAPDAVGGTADKDEEVPSTSKGAGGKKLKDHDEHQNH